MTNFAAWPFPSDSWQVPCFLSLMTTRRRGRWISGNMDARVLPEKPASKLFVYYQLRQIRWVSLVRRPSPQTSRQMACLLSVVRNPGRGRPPSCPPTSQQVAYLLSLETNAAAWPRARVRLGKKQQSGLFTVACDNVAASCLALRIQGCLGLGKLGYFPLIHGVR